MAEYRKKPVVIEAVRFQGPLPFDAAPSWLTDALLNGSVYYRGPHLTIETLEGQMRADFGDWIIRGVKGELYPCKPDIFEDTYEPVLAEGKPRP